MAARRSSAYTAAAALLCTFALLSSCAQADCGGFAETCDGLEVSPQGLLSCVCGNGRGGFDRADLDLNSFISNSNGNLVDGAGFAESCYNIRWYEQGQDNQGVEAGCLKEDGSVSTTLFNVERRVSNNGGILAFNSCRRRSLLESVDDAVSAIAGGRKMLQA